MKIAIISDVHNNEVNLKKVLDFCVREDIKIIICCGDLASMETLDFLNDTFHGEIFFCFGNMDDGHLKNYDFESKYKKNCSTGEHLVWSKRKTRYTRSLSPRMVENIRKYGTRKNKNLWWQKWMRKVKKY